MNRDAMLNGVAELARAAILGNLLSEVDSLAAGIERSGWVRGAEGGRWLCPDDQAWNLWSADHAADWVTWHGGEATVSINVQPAQQPGRVRVPAHLQFAIERIDTPSEGLPRDDERALRVARTGSPVARWYLAGEDDLPDDIVELLRHDEDPAVSAAVDARFLKPGPLG
ncbi:hypothetical protein [Cryobacterium sp. CG_9.6]|uniref:hypothetical protein n=1 Tax=Cryobacterium sp. CG_9.6 TaxID=2760710 RepID=UPI0024747F29|nr:hypothetical protein [Cryobacterium sp. CG_9.6]MDH6238388.1 hypothetical protein [Cryobacterium sp. CG_9.6]